MPDFFDTAELSKTLVLVQSRITNYRGDRTFNKERTKASIIEPVLRVLGWDTNDPEDVDREYKPKSRDNPVDYALLLRRTPCLLLEARALRDGLRDEEVVKQSLGQAGQHVRGGMWSVSLGAPLGRNCKGQTELSSGTLGGAR